MGINVFDHSKCKVDTPSWRHLDFIDPQNEE